MIGGFNLVFDGMRERPLCKVAGVAVFARKLDLKPCAVATRHGVSLTAFTRRSSAVNVMSDSTLPRGERNIGVL